jgi:hypothetical protein
MSCSLSDWLPHSPFRRLDWRWRRASYLALQRKPRIYDFDDEWVIRAHRFLEADGRKRDRVVSGALALFREESLRRSELEALLLTDAPTNEIAKRCSVSLAVGEAYARLFYSARELKRSAWWILSQTSGSGLGTGAGRDGLGSIWKLFAVKGGVKALEVAIAVTLDRPLPPWAVPTGADSARSAEAELRSRVNLAIEAMTVQSAEGWAAFENLVKEHCKVGESNGRQNKSPKLLEPMISLLELANRSETTPPAKKKPQPRNVQDFANITTTNALLSRFLRDTRNSKEATSHGQ